jgi:hypothetical protein
MGYLIKSPFFLDEVFWNDFCIVELFNAVYNDYKCWLGIQKCWNEIEIIRDNYDPNQVISLY